MSAAAGRSALRRFERATWRSPAQVMTTAIGLAAGWFLTDKAVAVSWPLGAVSSLMIAVFTVRAFIIFHDCGHGSFSRSRRLNTLVGTIIGIVVFTPYAHWTRAHRRHHATTGDLDRRGSGDVWTMTTEEYRAASPSRRLYYRIYHHPLFLMSIGPLVKLVIVERLILDSKLTDRRLRISVYLTNAGIAGFVVLMSFWMGVSRYIAVQLMAWFPATSRLFTFLRAAPLPRDLRAARRVGLRGSLAGEQFPACAARFLQWVTGNIGFHDIHHLAPRIPNYRLPEAQAACPPGRSAKSLSTDDAGPEAGVANPARRLHEA